MQTSRAEQQSADDKATKTDAERRTTALTSKQHRATQSDAENNDSRTTQSYASSRVEGRCADDGYNEIDSDAEIPAE
jgi:hypothetical protein